MQYTSTVRLSQKAKGMFFRYVKSEHGVFGHSILKMAAGADRAILVKKSVDSENANCI